MLFSKGYTPWNKGKKISETHPQMGFKKGNQNWKNPKSEVHQFKDGERRSSTTEFKKGSIAWNKGIEYLQIRGENHHFWKGGREFWKVSEKKHLCTKYKYWMLSVKKRDGWKCKIANTDCSGRLEAHHILNWVDYPELRYEINNGITLCRAHHPIKWAEEKRLIPTFQELVSVTKV